MRFAVKDFAKFYQSELGKISADLILQYIEQTWQFNAQDECLGYGFSAPIFNRIANSLNKIKPKRIVNYRPHFEFDNQDLALAENDWVIGEENRTPFKDGQFEKILCLSGLEESENPHKTMRELWRILAPEGSLILIVPNRRGVWARFDNSPFGHGRPFSRTQLQQLSNECLFEVQTMQRILFIPPFDNELVGKIAAHFEKLGKNLWPSFGGLLFFELKKRVFIEPPMDKSPNKVLLKPASASFFSKQD
jgi:SAM-dependent methyltransferase